MLGAGVGYVFRVPVRWVAGVMAFGSGVLISALSFELMEEAFQRGGLLATGGGFLAGATVFTVSNMWLSGRGAKHRKRSGEQQAKTDEDGSGLSIALGALLDGIPESIVIGLSLLEGGVVGGVAVAAIFLSNIPEGLSSAAGMKKAGRSAAYVFGLWSGIAVTSGLAAIAGYVLFDGAPAEVVAAITAVAAGAILAMLVETMIPEAFSDAHDLAGLIAVLGFLCAFGLSKMNA